MASVMRHKMDLIADGPFESRRKNQFRVFENRAGLDAFLRISWEPRAEYCPREPLDLATLPELGRRAAEDW